ncbi:MAG TPA: ABC transporter permease [Cyclobacteriaceae bacterium]|jgi:putative ABC transport system permease protein|nr:ABC transporter permease [Cyclobacteriaceae bacterium]
MLKNYFKTAVRSLLRHRFFSAINVFGLAVAMALSMVIIMLVADQMMYDRYNTKRARIYRVNSIPTGRDGGMLNATATTTLPLHDELLEKYTGIEKAVRVVRGFGNMWLEIEQNVNIPVAGFYVDPEALDLFEYELEHGDKRTALTEPFSVVLTKKTAKKLFRQENPVGESFKVGEDGPYKVTGVLKETNHKSHIVFDALASISTVKKLQSSGRDRGKDLDNWYQYTAGWVYVLLEKGKTVSDIRPHFEKIQNDHFSKLPHPDTQVKINYSLQQLMSITPGAFINNPIGPFLPWIFVYFFIGLAAVVMLTSCFNFTNLSIARSLTRAREIGVRKVTGARRWQIFTQFLSESVIVSLFALVVAIVLLICMKPLMAQLSFARLMKWDLEGNYFVYGVFIVFALVVGIIAGLFPALVMSGFQPVKVLKGITNTKLFSRMGLRKSLLVAQFTFSLIFILSVIVVFNQLQLFLRADHGFNMSNKAVVSLSNTSPQTLKTELLKYSNIENVTVASHIPAAGTSYGEGYKRSLDEKDWASINYFSVDEDYLKNISVPLIAGKFFEVNAGDANKKFIVLNEKAVQTFHFKDAMDAIGQEIILQRDSSRFQIIGVVKNYNHQLLMEKMDPLALVYNPSEYRLLQVQYTGSFEKAGESIEAAWAKINPALKVDYKDFNQEVHKIYDIFFGDLVSILSLISFLAILISCLGLLGMATYATETRIKEISIRKVLGSSDGSLVYLLSKGFVVVLLIAILIAVPSAYFLNNLWLEQLAYHVSVDVTVIGLGITVLVLFGTLTIGSQTYRAVFINPVDNLKSE